MKVKLAVSATFLFLFGCGLNTAGQGPGDDDSPYDIQAEEVEPDITETDEPETDAADDHFELTEEDVSPETPDEASEVDDDETTDEADSEDAEDGEAGEEDGETDDGGTVDPCTPPEIPTDGLYLFFCFTEDITSEMVMWRWVRRDWGPSVIWEPEPGCHIASSRVLACPVEIYHDATYYFNIEMPGTGPIGWSCGPGLAAPMGTPRVWLYGIPLAVTFADNGAGGCNHTFTTPAL